MAPIVYDLSNSITGARVSVNLCKDGQVWLGHAIAKSIDLYEFIDTFLPELEEQRMAVSVFPTLESESYNVRHEEIIDDLNGELENY